MHAHINTHKCACAVTHVQIVCYIVCVVVRLSGELSIELIPGGRLEAL